ncbi:MAG TPA: competence/damage-inducible protein A [Vicinamibacteria bacterium]|nr:competence/damage-inducible protein A [Vicinamibacteria bacterium]
MQAEILAVGEELLAPGRVETNSLYLTEKLAAVGVPVGFRGIVGDEEGRIAAAIRHALERSELVLVSGGLGPTADDRTRDAACQALGISMRLDEEILEGLRKRFAKRGIEMPEVNRRQAMVPEGATVLENRRGTAPGLFIETLQGRILVLLPGPPRELEPMFDEQVRPRLRGFAGDFFYRTRKLWVAGLPESSVEQKIVSTYQAYENPLTTILAAPGQVEIRLTARERSAAAADALNEELAAKLRAILGEHVFSEWEESLEAVVGSLLHDAGMRIAVAESITGGLIAHRITQVSGASRYFDTGFVTYSNESKTALLGVAPDLFRRVGAVSEEVALAMARGALERASADIAVSVTGVAGPTGGSDEKPVGLVYIGLATRASARAERRQFPGERRQVKRWTAQTALDLVRLELLRLSRERSKS